MNVIYDPIIARLRQKDPITGADLSGVTTADIAESTDKKYITNAEETAIGTIGNKIDKNTAITGATKTKITYDADGLVTAGADATTADIADSSNKRYVTDANLLSIADISNKVDKVYGKSLTSDTEISKLGTYPVFPVESSNQVLSDTGTFVDVSVPVGGFANNLYLSAVDVSDPVQSPTIKLLSYTADVSGTELATNVVAADGDKLVRSFLYPAGVATSLYPGGLWTFNLYSRVSSAAGVTQIGVRYFKYATDTTKTYVFSSIVWSNELNNTTDAFADILTVQPSFAVDPTDRMGVDIYVKTTATATRTVTLTLGDGYASHINTPNMIRHSQLRDKNGEADVQHLTAAQITSISEFNGSFNGSNSTNFAWTDNTLAITHGLNKQFVDVLIYDNNNVLVDYTLTGTSTSVVTVSFPIGAIPITGTYNVRIK